MRALWTIARLILLLAALAVLFLTPVFRSSPSGTTVDTAGALVDAVALVVALAAAWSLWRDRRSLV